MLPTRLDACVGIVWQYFDYAPEKMATMLSCSTRAVHCHAIRQNVTLPRPAVQRKPLLRCSSSQTSFHGSPAVPKSHCQCVGAARARSGNGVSIKAEQSYIMIKPDGVQRALVGQIINRFERKGFTLKALKMFTPTKQLAEEHYKDLSSKPFFGKLVDYIISGPVIAMVNSLFAS